MKRKGFVLALALCLAVGSGEVLFQKNRDNGGSVQVLKETSDVQEVKKEPTEEPSEESSEDQMKEQLQESRKEKVELLDAMEGSYNEKRIILTDITKSDAQKMAENLNAEVKITDDEKYAVLYLDENEDMKSVLEDDAYLEYTDNMIPDFYGTLCSDDSLVNSRSIAGLADAINLKDTRNVTNGDGVKVAVIDTGIDTDNPYLASRISKDSFNARTGKSVADYDLSVIEEGDTLSSHGTKVASVIAADSDGENGIGGIAPGVELVVIKIVDDGNMQISASDVIFAMAYAIEKDVDIINMSFSFEYDENPFAKYTQLAVDSDIICVASAGNHGTSAREWPASDENVIGAGAVSRPKTGGLTASATITDTGAGVDTYTLNEKSNYGDNVDVVAPDGIIVTNAEGQAEGLTGTSASCALTTGALALYVSQNKNQEYETVKEVLYAAGNDMGTPGIDWYYGCGMIDVDALVTEEKGTITYDCLTEELKKENHIFVRGHKLQNVPEPERTYSVFDGWYHDIQCLDEWDNLEEALYDDVTVYAAWANEDDTQPYSYYVKEDGTAEITGYLGKRRYLTIPEKIEGYTVTSLGTRAFAENSRLRRVDLPDTLTEIKDSVFTECTRLSSIKIPSKVTRIGSQAFWGCPRLGTVEIDSQGALAQIDDLAFAECGSLLRFDIPAHLEKINATVFMKDMSLRTLTVAEGNTVFETDGQALYGNLEGKETLVYYATGRSGIYQMKAGTSRIGENAFAYARLSDIEFAEDVEELGKEAFCSSRIVKVTLPDKLTAITDGAFRSCDSLRTVVLGKGIKEIGESAFAWNTSLEEVVTAEENILEVIGSYAFCYCTKLQNVEFIGEKCKKIADGAFYGCESVKKVTLPAGLQQMGEFAFASCINLETLIFEDGIELSQLENWVFNGCVALKNIVLPEGLKKIGDNCFLVSGLEYIFIPSTVEEIGYGAFGYCQSMKKIEVAEDNLRYYVTDNVLFEKNYDKETKETQIVLHTYPTGLGGAYQVPDNVTQIADWAFYAAEKLTDIQFGKNIVSIGDHAFGLCYGLKELVFNDKLQKIGTEAFGNCEKIQSVICNTDLQKIGRNAFWYCTMLSDVRLNNGLVELENGVFNGCYSLAEILLPDSLQTIGEECFAECTSLTSMEISKGVISIGMNAFRNDRNLNTITFAKDCVISRLNYGAFSYSGIQSIVIPESVTSMGQEIFSYCTELKSVTFAAGSKLEALAAWTFLNTPSLQSVQFEDGAALKKIEARAFERIENLQTIDVSKCEELQTIDNYALNGCCKLTEFVIPEKVTQIGRYAFYGCSNLTELHMPEAIDFIGRYAFANIPNIQIYFDAPVLPEHLQENWDYGIRGYYLGTGEKKSNTEWEYSLLSDGTAVLVKYIGTESVVTVTDVDGYAVSAIGANVLTEDSTVEELSLPETVLTISNYAFENAGKLRKIVLPSSVKMIGSYAFWKSGIQEVVFGENSQLTYIDAYAFADTKGLHSIEIPETTTQIRKYAFYNSSLEKISFGENAELSEIGRYAFANAGLTAVHLPDHELKVDYHAFNGNTKLTDLNLGTGKVQLYGYAFYNTALTEVKIPENVEYIGEYCFSFCKELKTFEVAAENKYYSSDEGILFNKTGLKLIQCPAGKTGSYTIPDHTEVLGFGAFEGSNLSKITITDGSSLTSIGYKAFYDCEKITSMYIPATVESLDYYAFAYCKKLETLEIATGSKMNGIYEGALYGCESVKEIQIPDTVREIGEYAFYGCEALETAEITENSELQGIYGHAFEHTAISAIFVPDTVLEIGEYAFANCKLKKFTSGENVEELGEFAFSNNTDMTEFTFGRHIMSAGRGILQGNAAICTLNIYCLANCEEVIPNYIFKNDIPKGLTEVHLENVNKIPEKAFDGIRQLKRVTSDGSISRIGAWAFQNCTNLEELTGTENVEHYGFCAFYSCEKLNGISFESTKTIDMWAFIYCSSLSNGIFSSAIEEIGEQAFYWTSLGEVVLPEKENGTLHLAKGAFCTARIERIVIGEGLTTIPDNCFGSNPISEIKFPSSLSEIGEEAFRNTDLKRIVMGENVKKIGKNAFEASFALRQVILNEGLQEIDAGAFDRDEIKVVWIPESVSKIGSGAFSEGNIFFEADHIPENAAEDWYTQSDDTNIFMNCGKIYESDHMYYYLDNDGGVLVYYDGEESSISLALPEEKQIYKICGSCFEENSSLIHVNLGESVKIIGDNAFKDCINLETITAGNIKEIGKNAFYKCTALKSIDNLNKISSIGKYAFFQCENMDFQQINKSVSFVGEGAFSKSGISSFAVSGIQNVTIEAEAFKNCKKLQTVKLSGKLEKLETGVFDGCEMLTDIEMENCETVEIGENAFRNCTELREIVLPESIKKLGNSCFYDCSSIQKLEIPQNAETIGEEAFRRCYALRRLIIPQNITNIRENAFKECNNLFVYFEASELPEGLSDGWDSDIKGFVLGYVSENTTEDGFSYYLTQKGAVLYKYTGEASELILNEIDGYKVYEIREWTFSENSTIQKLVIGDNVEVLGAHIMGGNEYGGGDSTLKEVYFGKNVREIGEYAFTSCSSLEKVKFDPECKLTYLSEHCFNYCVALKDIELSSQIGTLGKGCFFKCEELEHIELPSGITEIPDNLFGGCKKLKSLNLPPNIERIGTGAFDYVTKEKEDGFCYIGKYLISTYYNSAEHLEYKIREDTTVIAKCAMSGCMAEKVIIPEGVKYLAERTFSRSKIKELVIPNSVEEIAKSALQSMDYLESLSIPYLGVKGYTFANMFQEADSFWIPGTLKELIITGDSEKADCHLPDQVKRLCFTGKVDTISIEGKLDEFVWPKEVHTISKFLVAGGGIRKIVIPESVMTIGESAFAENTGVEEIMVPESVLSIGRSAFRDCSSLKKFEIPAISGRLFDFFAKDGEHWVITNTMPETLKKITIVGTPEIIPAEYFRGCQYLEEIELPDSVKEIGMNAFTYCSKLSELKIPPNCEIIGDYAFSMLHLKGLSIPATVKKIGNCIFSESDLETLEIEGKDTEIKCLGANYIKNIVLPYVGHSSNNLCSLKEILALPPYEISNLETVVLLDSCTSMPENAFEGITGIDIYCYADVDATVWPNGWNNGNRVHYLNQWNYIRFMVDGKLIASSAHGTGDPLKLPAKSMYEKSADEDYEYTFVGWDIDGDGKAENLFTATLRGAVVAEAVYSKVPRTQVSSVNVTSIGELAENKAILDATTGQADTLKSNIYLNTGVVSEIAGKVSEIHTDNGVISLDGSATGSIAAKAQTVNLTLEQIPSALMEETAGKDRVYQLTLTDGSKNLGFDGTAEIHLPYVVSDAETPVITYLSDDGKQAEIGAYYSEKEKKAVFTTSHFSLYALESRTADTSTISFETDGVISLKRLLNHYFLKNWSSNVIKKSLEAYFFTQNTKLYFFKNILKHTNLLALQTCN